MKYEEAIEIFRKIKRCQESISSSKSSMCQCDPSCSACENNINNHQYYEAIDVIIEESDHRVAETYKEVRMSHGCYNCKYRRKDRAEEPCSSCTISNAEITNWEWEYK